MAGGSRVANDLGLVRTMAWIADSYGDEENLEVSRIQIDAAPSLCSGQEHDRLLGRMRSRNESELHAFLKLAAHSWLQAHSSYPDTIAWEVLCYSPIPEQCAGRTVLSATGEEFDVHSPQVLYDNHENFPLSYGYALRLDLHSFDISVEVGGTSAFNLLTPLLDGLVDKAIWLPYPIGVSTSGFRRAENNLGTVNAYSITLC